MSSSDQLAQRSFCLTNILTLIVACVLGTAARAEETPQTVAPEVRSVAGRSLSEWAADLKSPREVVRLRASKTVGAFGVEAVPILLQALQDSSAGVRYWAASGLGDLGAAAKPANPEQMKRAVALLEAMLGEKSPALRICGAYALCRWGLLERGLPALTQSLKDPQPAVAMSAADFLARIGPPAESAIPALEEAVQRKDDGVHHVDRAAEEALRQIRQSSADESKASSQ